MKTHFYTRPSKSGELTIYARLIEANERVAFSTQIKVQPNKWNQSKQQIEGRELYDRQSYVRLERLKAKIFNEYDQMLRQDNYSLTRLKRVIVGEVESKNWLLKEFGRYISYQESQYGGVTKGTLKKYRAIYSHLETFVELEYGQQDIELRKIKKSFIVRFWEYLRGTARVGQNTSAKYIRHVKKVFRSYVEKGFIDAHPFPNYTQRVVEEKKEFLTLAELESIEGLDISNDRLELIRDAFLFSCYTGLAYTDLKNLTVDHLHDGMVRMIRISRQKTGVDSTVPVLPKAQEIMDKYAEHPLRLRDGVIIPMPSNQKTNAYLKEIAELAQIKKNLTFHMARHTFGTTVTLSNNVPIETVSRMMGHSSLKMTQHYAKVLDAKIQADMLHLIHGQRASGN